jgi:hypothetical protein
VGVIEGPPVIISQPAPFVADANGRVVFRVSTDGTWPCVFQWYLNDQPIPGATNVTLVLEGISAAQAGAYSVEVHNALGSIRSASAVLTVVPKTVYAWGANDHGQCDVPQGLTNVVALAGNSYCSLALHGDGTLTGWGYCRYPDGLSNLIAIACGSSHTLALKADGTVLAWGDTYYNQTSVPQGLSNVVAIAAGWYHSLVLKNDGTVVCWGGDRMAPVPPGLTNVVAIAAGSHHNLALRSDGTVASWSGGPWSGTNYCAPPAGLSNAVAVAGGYKRSWALQSDGNVMAWSWPHGASVVVTNLFAEQDRMVAIASGQDHLLALREDGTVAASGSDHEGQLQAPAGLTNVVQIACGYWHSLALVQSEPPNFCLLSAFRCPRSGQPQVTLTGPIGARILIEATSDLRTWTPLMTVMNTQGSVLIRDPAADGSPQRFYRAQIIRPPAQPVGDWEYQGYDVQGTLVVTGRVAFVTATTPLAGSWDFQPVHVPHVSGHFLGQHSFDDGELSGQRVTVHYLRIIDDEFVLSGQMGSEVFAGTWQRHVEGRTETGSFMARRIRP